jgi:NADH:ubiquinone oxidoreductase subunit F (NADH-binding)
MNLPYQSIGLVKNNGLVEVPMGLSIRRVVLDTGGGAVDGRPVKAVQIGGPRSRSRMDDNIIIAEKSDRQQ